MKPPCRIPRSARQARKDDLPLSQNWEAATMLHRVICVGIQRSGPIHFEMSWEGSSAQRKLRRKTEFPRL